MRDKKYHWGKWLLHYVGTLNIETGQRIVVLRRWNKYSQSWVYESAEDEVWRIRLKDYGKGF